MSIDWIALIGFNVSLIEITINDLLQSRNNQFNHRFIINNKKKLIDHRSQTKELYLPSFNKNLTINLHPHLFHHHLSPRIYDRKN